MAIRDVLHDIYEFADKYISWLKVLCLNIEARYKAKETQSEIAAKKQPTPKQIEAFRLVYIGDIGGWTRRCNEVVVTS